MAWQLGENEAVVLVGQTPPGVRYFSYDRGNHGRRAVDAGSDESLVGATVGDTINIGTIHNNRP